MDELISRQAAIEVLEWFDQTDPLGHTPGQIVRALPTAEPRTGKWVAFANEGGELDLRCSVCGEEQGFFFGYFNYCPNCGARMEESE